MAVGDPAALHHPDQSSPRATRPDLRGGRKKKKNPRKGSTAKATDQHRGGVDRAVEGFGGGRSSEGGIGPADVHVTARAGRRRWGAEEQSGAVTTR